MFRKKKKSKSEITLSVVVLSFNTKNITDKCLSCLMVARKEFERKFKGKIEVIVVDNASSDNSAMMVKKKYPWVKLISEKENTGFARGNNIAMKKARGDYFLLLNSDAYVGKNTLVDAISYMSKNEDCDVLGCKLVYEDGKFQPSSGFLPTVVNVPLWMFGIDKVPILQGYLKPFHPNHRSFFAEERKVGWIMGAFMLVKREVFEETGGFDEEYFMYTEEVEWCRRISDLGFRVYFTPKFQVTHLLRASGGFDVKKPISKEGDGVIYYFQKHYPKYAWIAKYSIIFGYLLRVLAFAFLGNRGKFEGYRDYIFELLWRK